MNKKEDFNKHYFSFIDRVDKKHITKTSTGVAGKKMTKNSFELLKSQGYIQFNFG